MQQFTKFLSSLLRDIKQGCRRIPPSILLCLEELALRNLRSGELYFVTYFVFLTDCSWCCCGRGCGWEARQGRQGRASARPQSPGKPIWGCWPGEKLGPSVVTSTCDWIAEQAQRTSSQCCQEFESRKRPTKQTIENVESYLGGFPAV